MAAFPQPFFAMAAFPQLELTCAAMGVAMADNVHAELRSLRRQNNSLKKKEAKLDKRCIKVLNKAFAEPTLTKFDIALSAAAVHPNLTIKRESDALTGENIVRVTFHNQKLSVQFDRRGKAIWYDKQIRHVRKFKDVVDKYLYTGRKCLNIYAPGVAKTRKHASMKFSIQP